MSVKGVVHHLGKLGPCLGPCRRNVVKIANARKQLCYSCNLPRGICRGCKRVNARIVNKGEWLCDYCQGAKNSGAHCGVCGAPLTQTSSRYCLTHFKSKKKAEANPPKCARCGGNRNRGPYALCRSCNYEQQRNDGMYGRLIELAAGSPALEALAQHWRTHVGGDRSPYEWARRHWDLLVAACPTDFSRIALVGLPFSIQSINGLCFYLELAGLMEPVSVDIDRFMHRVKTVLAGVLRRDALLLEDYARMILGPRAQRRATYGERCDPKMHSQVQAIKTLALISRQIIAGTNGVRSLATMQQADVQASKADGRDALSIWDGLYKHHQTFLRAFLRWHNKQRPRAARLQVPKIRPTTRRVRITDDELLALHARAHDEEWPLLVRLAALLIILYRQPLNKIASLHVAQLKGDCTKLRFTDVWIALPAPLPELFRAQLTSRRHQNSPWVFPSRIYRGRRPITLKSLDSQMTAVKFPTIRARGGATVKLLRSVEYPLLARILGIDLQTAAAWAQLVGSPSEDHYVAIRRQQDREKPKTVTVADRVYGQYQGCAPEGELGPSSPPAPRPGIADAEFEAKFAIQRVVVGNVIQVTRCSQ